MSDISQFKKEHAALTIREVVLSRTLSVFPKTHV